MLPPLCLVCESLGWALGTVLFKLFLGVSYIKLLIKAACSLWLDHGASVLPSGQVTWLWLKDLEWISLAKCLHSV